MHARHREIVDRARRRGRRRRARAPRAASEVEQLRRGSPRPPSGNSAASRSPLIANGRVASAAASVARLGHHPVDPAPQLLGRVRGRREPAARGRRRAGAARRRAPRGAARPWTRSGGRTPGSRARPRGRCRAPAGSIVAGAAHHDEGGVDQPAHLGDVLLPPFRQRPLREGTFDGPDPRLTTSRNNVLHSRNAIPCVELASILRPQANVSTPVRSLGGSRGAAGDGADLVGEVPRTGTHVLHPSREREVSGGHDLVAAPVVARDVGTRRGAPASTRTRW